MGFAETLQNIVTPAMGPRCSVCKTIDELPAEDRDVIVAAFNNPSIRSADLRRVFLAEGYNFTSGTVGRHRRKECRQ